MISALERRARTRDAHLRLAGEFVRETDHRFPVIAAAVIGSVARGDFNDSSDIDVILISDALPRDAIARSAALYEDVPARIEPKGYTRDEFRAMLSKRNPIAVSTLRDGVILADPSGFIAELAFHEEL